MHAVLKNTIKFILFLGVSVFLFWLVYRDQNWEDLLVILQEDVDYTWVAVACVMGIASHVSRALRWQMMVESMGYRICFWNSFMGVMIGYFANLAIPRMGEFTRCGVVSRYENVPFPKLLGNVVTERVIDLMILLLLTLVAVLTQFSQLGVFIERHPEMAEKMHHMLNSGWTLALVAVCFLVAFLFWKYYLKRLLKGKVTSFVQGLKEGLMAVMDIKNKFLFIFHSLFIWLMYFLMFYVCFFCFEFTSDLGMTVALAIFVLSSYGMVAPVQGGIGAWHFMVISALVMYLPEQPDIERLAKTFALLTHSSMTLLYIVVGILCIIMLPVYNWKSFKRKRR